MLNRARIPLFYDYSSSGKDITINVFSVERHHDKCILGNDATINVSNGKDTTLNVSRVKDLTK